MFARLSTVTVALALAIPMIVASPARLDARTDACNNGSIECCNKVVQGGTPLANSIAGLLGITGSVGELLGLNCVPINVVGTGGTTCSQQTVCCNGNNFNGVVVVGCSPLAISV